MIKKLYFYDNQITDPYYNLALEEYFLKNVKDNECILYLWQNKNTVVIGKNQDAYNECLIDALEQDGGKLARRLSGGGAVYHDLGNLNFTFLLPKNVFDTDKQTEVILRAVKILGIEAERSGRNDLTVNGRKFSGHAYYHTGDRSYHHGTVMVDVKADDLSKYLNVSMLKLQSKGVKSVRSRIINLRSIDESITIDSLKQALLTAFAETYGLTPEHILSSDIDSASIEAAKVKFASSEWIYGVQKTYDESKEARFEWGTVKAEYSLDGDVLKDLVIWSDSLEADFIGKLPKLFKGLKAEKEILQNTVQCEAAPLKQIAADIASLITLK